MTDRDSTAPDMRQMDLPAAARSFFSALDTAGRRYRNRMTVEEIGRIISIGQGVARASGLSSVQSEELVRFEDGGHGLAFNLDPQEIGIVMLGESDALGAGSEVRRTGRVIDVPVGEELIGRIINILGHPLDEGNPPETDQRYPIEQDAPSIMDRSPVTVPLETGIKVIDALIPIGRGQRELILGDRQTGKTAVALDTIVNQRNKDVLCIYCSIGQRNSAVAKLIRELEEKEALAHTVVMVAAGEEPPGVRYIAPYAATAIAEYFMHQGRDVLIVYDDLSKHAIAYRELSLLLRRPPGREAYPGDIFYIHSRLLERATHLHEDLGGGSLTALPIIETEAQNVSAYIPTNLISITDGQIYLSPELFKKGVMPAVEPGRSVSRVGGKTQLTAYRSVAGNLRLSYSQFIELEKFARFSTRLDEDTRQALERGRRVREILKQNRYTPLTAPQQVFVLLAVNDGVFDQVPLAEVRRAEQEVIAAADSELSELSDRINQGEKLSDKDREMILDTARRAVNGQKQENAGAEEE